MKKPSATSEQATISTCLYCELYWNLDGFIWDHYLYPTSVQFLIRKLNATPGPIVHPNPPTSPFGIFRHRHASQRRSPISSTFKSFSFQIPIQLDGNLFIRIGKECNRSPPPRYSFQQIFLLTSAIQRSRTGHAKQGSFQHSTSPLLSNDPIFTTKVPGM